MGFLFLLLLIRIGWGSIKINQKKASEEKLDQEIKQIRQKIERDKTNPKAEAQQQAQNAAQIDKLKQELKQKQQEQEQRIQSEQMKQEEKQARDDFMKTAEADISDPELKEDFIRTGVNPEDYEPQKDLLNPDGTKREDTKKTSFFSLNPFGVFG